MKKIIILLLCLVLVSCGTTNKSKSITKDTSENSSSRVKVKDKLIYKKDKSINSFLNKYNKINNPDITSDMVSMKKLKGKDKPDIVNISNDKLEIYIYGKSMFGNKMDVFVQNYSDNVTNDDFKDQFVKYSKVFDDSLTDEEIDEYWNNMLSGKNRGKKLKNIKVSRIIFYGRVKYLNLEGNIEFNSNNKWKIVSRTMK
ncbi:hypothetical protein GPK27_11240 [Catenibacterium mitsuokai]|uniref:hypothetical protein n=1 Tax=Catenibacterium mitsuokai TaxID=100886 RepID=UPI001C021155|nr:hypothetical protein [Catenibacterium mitsuokai]MBT9815976.1 hypothetical protein [Catenibacterium mitsuokai]